MDKFKLVSQKKEKRKRQSSLDLERGGCKSQAREILNLDSKKDSKIPE
jgi:hypothetical protein